MKLFFLGQDDLYALKTNIISNISHYRQDDAQWIHLLLSHDPFIPFKRDVNFFELNPHADEVDNAKTLYLSMQHISDSEAVDERLWAGMAHGSFWGYMSAHILHDLEKNTRLKLDDGLIRRRYFFDIKRNARKRSLFIHSLSKLWWVGRLTFDAESKGHEFDSLELFRTAFSHKAINTFSSSFMANPEIRFALFDTALWLRNQGIEIKGDTMVPLSKFLNELGGQSVIDTFSREELSKMLKNHADDHIEEIRSR